MSESSEEKVFEPSDQKLERLRREEGAVPNLSEFIGSMTLALGIGYLAFTVRSVWERSADLMSEVLELARGDFPVVVGVAAAAAVRTAGYFAAGLFGFLLLVGVVLSIVANRGILFSLKRISLDFTRLDPMKGLMNIFNKNSLVGLAKGMLRFMILASIGVALLSDDINEVFWTASCGGPCVVNVAYDAVTSMIGSFVVVLIAFAVADLRISTALFRHEQRMTHTEVKQETKEQFGSPEIRQERDRLRRQNR